MKRNLRGLFISAVAGCSLAAAAFAAEPVERYNINTLWFENWGSLSNATLTVTGPESFREQVFVEKGSPRFQLRAPVKDGTYFFELTAASDEKVKVDTSVNNGRENQPAEMAKPFQMTGYFIVSRGAISAEALQIEEEK